MCHKGEAGGVRGAILLLQAMPPCHEPTQQARFFFVRQPATECGPCRCKDTRPAAEIAKSQDAALRMYRARKVGLR